MLLRLLALARAPVELAEAEVAVGDERAHAAGLGEGQRLLVVVLDAAGDERGMEPGDLGQDPTRPGDVAFLFVLSSEFQCCQRIVPSFLGTTEQ